MFNPEDIEIGNPSFFQLDPEQVKDLKYVVKNYQPGDNLVLEWRKLSGPVWALVRPARSGKLPRSKELLDRESKTTTPWDMDPYFKSQRARGLYQRNCYDVETGRWIGPDPEPKKFVETFSWGGVVCHFGHDWGENCTPHCLRKGSK